MQMQIQKTITTISMIIVVLFLFTCESTTSNQSSKKVVNPQSRTIEAAAFGTTPLTFVENEKCKSCHPLIYDEFIESSHHLSTIYSDPIHAAIWNLHPMNQKKQQYSCAKCHTPGADNAADFITEGKKGMPDANNRSQAQGVSCASCHRIASIEEHAQSNTPLFSTENKTYFSGRPSPKEDPYHDIITDNTSFNKADACLACHSHNLNKANLAICAMEIKTQDQRTGDNCMNCHMPQVEGSMSNERETSTHAFHGFPGTHKNPEMLAENITLMFGKNETGFTVIVQNRSPHDLFLQPLRVGKLKTKVIRKGKTIKEFSDQLFVKILGKDGKPAFPWEATEIIKNTMLEAGKAVTFNFETTIQKGDAVEVTLGYHLVNPKAASKLKLDGNKEATKFRILKKQTFTFSK